ncbi:hypothetical protein BATDEDRAFT_25119 [Batrachochytrium dendrobatidis JAM81]|uniref:Ribosomal protein/NADH dehydrogenase domain-containing protein n=2 Tax=Batrachochytrium dendrobatidis TaxID=109871 RepID=F4P2N7_BATDJ|nr:uncharacterized protein BATDEDRAFT_25119 [Batrachochytrium dendrobatidis JAM81]EGF80242.1 hypothetical protein BATDEDRAFT_25119 [Batrachochytrium dendrobatidis JAM81]KAK5670112.1 ndufa2, NADH:ubiquinone oxidoreductase 10.5kD subunit [Batrachochytrium dendrobatidis]OAJ40964.1 hypothetical protein BDEG_24634 [Batrachochytrium dendrobatidis JEL423]|eukprot:XP_006679024.1 hypothetical protein BATDEDRAFT_25119 [Batrachochytrium dendrobatidis JAM81]
MSWKSLLSKNIKELRIQLSPAQTSAPGSNGIRDFILSNYKSIKAANPHLPVLIREAPGTEARAIARYAFGAERIISLENLTAAQVETQFKLLAETKPSSSEL